MRHIRVQFHRQVELREVEVDVLGVARLREVGTDLNARQHQLEAVENLMLETGLPVGEAVAALGTDLRHGLQALLELDPTLAAPQGDRTRVGR